MSCPQSYEGGEDCEDSMAHRVPGGVGGPTGEGEIDNLGVDDLGVNENYSNERLSNIIKQKRDGDITVLYYNIGSLPKYFHDLHSRLAILNFNPDIIGLSETKVTNIVNSNYNPHLDSYKFYQSKSSTTHGSVGVFVKTSLDITIRDDLDISIPGIFETIWFDVNHELRGKHSTIGIVYRHPGPTSIPFFERRLETSLSKLNSKKSNVYLFGDFNINSLKYEETYNVKSFIDTMHSYSLVNLINKPTWFPRGKQPGKPSLLDHFYTNKVNTVVNIGLSVCDISDHMPIVATIGIPSKKNIVQNLNPYIRDFRNLNSAKFNESLSHFTCSDTENIDVCFYNLHNHFLNCVNNHIPLRKRTKRELKFALKPWITNSMKKSINERARLYRLSRIDHPNQNCRRTKYNRYKKILEKVLNSAEIKYFSDKCDEYQNQSKALWRTINEITKRKIKTRTVLSKLQLENGTFTENTLEIANTLNSYFVNVGPKLAEKLPLSQKSFESYLSNSPIDSFQINPTNSDEVLKIINSFSSSNCEDPVKISPKVYKLGANALSKILPNMINRCFIKGYFPDCLKLAKVTPIFKEGSSEHCINWRPISITCCTSKLMEKLVKKRLLSYLSKNKILTDFQFGYRTNHSTTHAILNISDNILNNFDKKMHTVSIFLDLSKGFDCVDHKILLRKLQHYGIRGVAFDFFKSYLTNRRQQTLVNGTLSEFLTVLCGVPQGSVLGPILFLLYTNDLANASQFAINLFADDTCLSLCNNNLNELQTLCNIEAAKIDEWFTANRLTTNSKKASNFLLSDYNGNKSSNFTIKMGKVLLKRVKSVKYLGVILDENVTWTEQIEYLSSKLSRSAGIFSKLRYYLKKDVLIRVYHALFNSHLQYGILCWGSTYESNLNRLQVLQNRAIRNISRAPRFYRLANYYLNYRILKVHDLYDLEISKFMHSHYNENVPSCFNSFFQLASNRSTRNATNHKYSLPRYRSARGQRSVRFYGPKVWNKLPTTYHNSTKVQFKKQCKNLILSKY